VKAQEEFRPQRSGGHHVTLRYLANENITTSTQDKFRASLNLVDITLNDRATQVSKGAAQAIKYMTKCES